MGKKHSERIYTEVKSLRHFAEKLAEFDDRIAYRYFDKNRNLLTMTYGELAERFRIFAAGLDASGLAGKRIAIIGETSVNWICAYVATIAAGGVAIPMDRELDVHEIEGFFAFAEADAVFFSETLTEKFAHLAMEHPTVSRLIPFAGSEDDDNPRILPLAKLLEAGKEKLADGYQYPEVSDPDRMAEMLFTSGTTGTSKCVMLSEKNICSAVNSACETVEFSKDDRIVSVLPIHHTYELCIMLAGLNYGMNIAINDSLKRVLKNFKEFQPTGLVLVPLFVNTMNKKIWEEAKKNKKDTLLKYLTGVSHTLRKLNFDVRKTLFQQVGSAFGGSLEKIVCGGAPLNPEIAESFSEFGIEIYEGYGITECAPLIAVNPYYAPKKGSVGPSVPACRVRIDADHQNDRGYGEGEIQVKGDNVMLGYYKNPEETAKVFTEDGWFCTGDIGYMDRDGYIFITGRKKNVIISDNGKNVFPEEIEEYLGELDCIAECLVVGRKNELTDSIELTALIYPAFDQFEHPDDPEEIKREIDAKIAKLNKKLVNYKQIKQIEIRNEPFPKTTSRKIKRHLVQ